MMYVACYLDKVAFPVPCNTTLDQKRTTPVNVWGEAVPFFHYFNPYNVDLVEVEKIHADTHPRVGHDDREIPKEITYPVQVKGEEIELDCDYLYKYGSVSIGNQENQSVVEVGVEEVQSNRAPSEHNRYKDLRTGGDPVLLSGNAEKIELIRSLPCVTVGKKGNMYITLNDDELDLVTLPYLFREDEYIDKPHRFKFVEFLAERLERVKNGGNDSKRHSFFLVHLHSEFKRHLSALEKTKNRIGFALTRKKRETRKIVKSHIKLIEEFLKVAHRS
jgi:hypothetical protein